MAASARPKSAPPAADVALTATRARNAHIVPDLLDAIYPSLVMRVAYKKEGSDATLDVEATPRLTRAQAAHAPYVELHGTDPEVHYTMLMVDPDAPDPAAPVARSWLHWLVTDIPGGDKALSGHTVTQYMGPTPPKGVHRYVFLLYQQQAQLGERAAQMAPQERGNFDVKAFAAKHKLVGPVGINFFETEAHKK